MWSIVWIVYENGKLDLVIIKKLEVQTIELDLWKWLPWHEDNLDGWITIFEMTTS